MKNIFALVSRAEINERFILCRTLPAFPIQYRLYYVALTGVAIRGVHSTRNSLATVYGYVRGLVGQTLGKL